MAAVPLHHKARRPAQAELGHQGVEVWGGVVAVGGEHQASSAFQIGAEGRHLIHETARRCKVLLRSVDDEQVAVVRDGIRQQVEGADREVLALQGVDEGARQGLLAVVGGVVGMERLTAGDAVDGSGELVFASEGHAVAAGGVVVGVVVIVEVRCFQHDALLSRDEDEAAVLRRLNAILGCKGRVNSRVFPLPPDVAALGGVAVQQLCEDGVLAARLGQIIDVHILRKAPGDLLGAVAEGVKPRLRKVKLGVLRRDSPDDEVEQDSQQDGQHGERGGVYAAFQAEALQRACALFLEFLHGQSPFQFQRRFSMPCAVKKRKSTAVVR